MFGDLRRKDGIYYEFITEEKTSIVFDVVRGTTEKLVKKWATDYLENKVAAEKYIDSIVECINKKQLKR